MTDIIVTLVFSVAMLVFMAFPAMKIIDWIKPKTNLDTQTYGILQILLTILLSLIIGLFLKFG